jgi:DNA-binding transcriptional LysR family regulator
VTEPFAPSQKTLNRSSLDELRVLSGPFWGELRTFLAVAKAKSFNRAAETLNVSQPSVSRQVKRLQDIIGSQLVLRTINGIELTQKGRDLAHSLLTLDEKLFEISTELKAETNDAEGLVRVSITEGLAGLFVVPGLSAFNEQFPRIKLHVRNPINLMSFRDNQTDVMLGFGPPSQAELTSTRLGYLHFIPVASKSYVERYGKPTLNDLKAHHFIDCEYYSAQTDAWAGWRKLVSQGVVAHICDNSYAYGLMVKCGYGIGLLCNYVVADADAVPLDLGVHTPVPIYIIAQTERLQARPVRLVYDWLSAVFGPNVPWFSPELHLDCPSQKSLTKTIEQSLAGPFSYPPPPK